MLLETHRKGVFFWMSFSKTPPKKASHGCSGCASTWPCTGEEVLPHVKGEERIRQNVQQSGYMEKQVCSAGCQGPSGRCIEQP